MKYFTTLFICVLLTCCAHAQASGPFYGNTHAVPYAATAGLDNSHYLTALLGTWYSEDYSQKLVVSASETTALHFDIYNYSSYYQNYQFEKTVYAPYSAESGGSYFFDWDVNYSNNYTSDYVTYTYSISDDDLYLSRIIPNYTYSYASSAADYRGRIHEQSNRFYSAWHFTRGNTQSRVSNSDIVAGVGIAIVGAAVLGWLFGDSPSAAPTPSNYNTNQSHESLFPLGRDENYQPVYNYDRMSDVKYDMDYNPK